MNRPINHTATDSADQDDRSIIEAIRSGHPDAPTWFVLAHQASVYRICLRMMRHQQDAEDLVQETFVRALRAINRFDLTRQVAPWLLGIAANRCRTALVQRSRRPMLGEQVGEASDHRPGLPDGDDVVAEIKLALDRLRPDYRQVFLMYHEDAMLYEEIAAAIDRPVGTVKTWLRRARGQLADDLARRGICC